MSPPSTDSPAEHLQDELRAGADAAQETAAHVGQQARERARSEIDDRTTHAAGRLREGAQDARAVAEHLRGEGRDAPARFVEHAAERVDGAGRYLTEADADRLIRDAEAYARRNPAAVVVGGLALGFAASRLLSASSGGRRSTSADQESPGTGSDRPRALPPSNAAVDGAPGAGFPTGAPAAPGPSTPAYAAPPADAP
ncbi:hypothetical protein [Paraconexibacter algicola]|uniref:Uncharacterized protein n=1 Tax=Paraconexibacter algicola TaxID=2133960 RepID=A0A2T4UL90_9ACTN|nr:hypothetical protein [Paraconexibacter algicola]PTL60009.1 hypothetical protein C7Y72_10295 [Paraconexibacter algicola]